MSNLPDDLQNMGVYEGYDRYVRQLEPVLQDMHERGVPVSPEAHAALRQELIEKLAALDAGIQQLVPDEVRDCSPKQGYKKTPKDTTNLAQRWFLVEHKGSKLKETRWCKLLPWKPSHAGLIRFMCHAGHTVPVDFKSGKPTTSEAELERLCRKTGHPLYAAVLEYRQCATVLNNHLVNWEPRADGRVHPTFYYDTGTGQLASRRPNAQNAPKHGEGSKKILADSFRGLVQASPGHTLVEFDYKSFHAQTLAFEADDADYLRLAKLDIHSYLTAFLVKEPDREKLIHMDNDSLRERLGQIKAKHQFVRDYRAKRAILGYGFGMGWKKLYNMYREAFDSQAEAKQTLDMLDSLFPRACAWRNEIRMKAHEQGYLLSRSGCVRWFWEVMRWVNGAWQKGGDDSERAVAFLPANDAFCHVKDAMLRLNTAGWLGRAKLINQIHDSLMFECPNEVLDEALDVVKGEMERPSEVLVGPVAPGGLRVEVGISAGPAWNKMKGV